MLFVCLPKAPWLQDTGEAWKQPSECQIPIRCELMVQQLYWNTGPNSNQVQDMEFCRMQSAYKLIKTTIQFYYGLAATLSADHRLVCPCEQHNLSCPTVLVDGWHWVLANKKEASGPHSWFYAQLVLIIYVFVRAQAASELNIYLLKGNHILYTYCIE